MQYSRPNLDQNLANFGQNCENLEKHIYPFNLMTTFFYKEAIDKGTLFKCLYRPINHIKRYSYTNPFCPGRQFNPHLPAR